MHVSTKKVAPSNSKVKIFIANHSKLLERSPDPIAFLASTTTRTDESLEKLIASGREDEATAIIEQIYFGFRG